MAGACRASSTDSMFKDMGLGHLGGLRLYAHQCEQGPTP